MSNEHEYMSEFVYVKLTAAEKEHLRARTARVGENMSHYIRRLIQQDKTSNGSLPSEAQVKGELLSTPLEEYLMVEVYPGGECYRWAGGGLEAKSLNLLAAAGWQFRAVLRQDSADGDPVLLLARPQPEAE